MYVGCHNKAKCIPFLYKELGMKSKKGNTALILAIEKNNIECVKLLLEESDILNGNG